MPQAQYGITLASGGVSIQKSAVRTGDHSNTYEIVLPTAKGPLTAWVKTDTDTAGGNLPAGHGYSNGNFDVYWAESGVKKVRYGVPGTISTNALTLDGGTGDAFPESGATDVIVCKQVTVNTAIDGDAVVVIGFSLEYPDSGSTSVGHLDMQDSGPASIEAISLTANVPIVYDISGGATNVFTGNPIVATKASHNDTVSAATLKIVSLEDSTT
jgi:hypothetical protein